MATADADLEYEVLTTESGRVLLESVESLKSAGPAEVERLRRVAAPASVAAALRIVATRRKGAAKFSRADLMWFGATGLEQATAEPVARHKAARFAGADRLVVDLCSGIGGDSAALAEVCAGGVVAVDRDPAMARRVGWNARVYGVESALLAVAARAESFPFPIGAWVHVDPDRRAVRAEGRRALSVGDYAPGLGFLHRLIGGGRSGAIKLGPASDFNTHFDRPEIEIELISLHGECKEAVVWFGAAVTRRRRATVLPGGASWAARDWPSPARLDQGAIGRWIHDPDPGLIRAGLVDDLGLAHGLSRFAPGIDYLTSDEAVDSPFLDRFEALAVLPLDFKRLRRELTARDVGPLVVKTRGVALSPEAVRARLRLSGTQRATLILAGGPGPARAILARRVGDA